MNWRRVGISAGILAFYAVNFWLCGPLIRAAFPYHEWTQMSWFDWFAIRGGIAIATSCLEILIVGLVLRWWFWLTED